MTQTKKTWFSGCFTYHLPVSDSQLGKAQTYLAYADKLLGVEPTPQQIWQSSPWTWALDWFANTGDVINNISQLGRDGLVMKYGYLMDYVSTKDVWSADAMVSGTAHYSEGYTVRVRENKKRIPASPYGFGVSDTTLSAVQKAVIAALSLQLVGKGARWRRELGLKEAHLSQHGVQSRTSHKGDMLMAFADPQSVTISGTAISLPRTSFGTNSGGFQSADSLTKLSINHVVGSRARRVIRLDNSKIAADPLAAGINVKAGMACYLVVDVPSTGYDTTQQKAVIDGFLAYLTASTSAKVAQLLGGES
jgi:hypothetical protein